MSLTMTGIVALLGVLGVFFMKYKSHLSGFLKAKQEIHTETQKDIETKVSTMQDEIAVKEQQIQQLQEKSDKATAIIQEIKKTNDESVQKILKEDNVANLIKEFDQW